MFPVGLRNQPNLHDRLKSQYLEYTLYSLYMDILYLSTLLANWVQRIHDQLVARAFVTMYFYIMLNQNVDFMCYYFVTVSFI